MDTRTTLTTTQPRCTKPLRRVGGAVPYRIVAAALVAFVTVATACTPPPSEPAPPGPPVLSNFRFVSERANAPVVAVLRWQVSDPNHDQLTCTVDTDSDGTVDNTITPCSSASSVLLQMPTAGSRTATIEVTDGDFPPVTATADITVGAAPTEGFEITLRLDAGMDPVFAAAFTDAAQRWSEVITADVPDVAANIPAGLVGWNPAFNGTVDDVLIDARAAFIDGPGQVLGQAGALLIRSGDWQPYYGIMQFDVDDLQALADEGQLDDVILHEMGHVLGLGSSWILTGVVTDVLTDPVYTGSAGVAAYQELGGSGYAPVEAGGGIGTALVHWRESTFGDELMTGYLGFGQTAISVLTVAALADQGYGVDLSAADPYTIPGSALRRHADSGPGTQPLGWRHAQPVQPMLDGPVRPR